MTLRVELGRPRSETMMPPLPPMQWIGNCQAGVARSPPHESLSNHLCGILKHVFRVVHRLSWSKRTIIEMRLNASGVRDTVRGLHISTDTVLRELRKKEPALESVNTALLRIVNSHERTVDAAQSSRRGYSVSAAMLIPLSPATA